ncbi:hypothetical protein CWI36_0496p0010 [Hamiltosporidium magnivora]|uniref:Uncharacterized protein n=1 Tax=Hamiltosporidium magnivora TaxID=148818 RepID=A0A4Q9LDX3_9MICR|nr:hypothetical protein CWI36_0496p0010 [Hamiltosporidium magnivora]
MLDNINHSWIRNIKIERFSKAVQQRLHSGIAGSRLFNIFRSNIPKNLNTCIDDLINIYNVIKEVADNGLFYEMHPFFMPIELANISLSKNLFNLLVKLYSKEEVEHLKNNKQMGPISYKFIDDEDYKESLTKTILCLRNTMPHHKTLKPYGFMMNFSKNEYKRKLEETFIKGLGENTELELIKQRLWNKSLKEVISYLETLETGLLTIFGKCSSQISDKKAIIDLVLNEKNSYNTEFYVLKDSPIEILLGNEFLINNKAVLDFKDKKLTICGVKYHLIGSEKDTEE